jgi:hypothetical protein
MCYNLLMLSSAEKEILKPCLWGASIESLDIKEDSFLIVERLLEHGGDKQINFVLVTYDRDTIAEVVKQSRYLTPKTVNYWCLYLGIKKEDTRCFTQQSPKMWPPSFPG